MARTRSKIGLTMQAAQLQIAGLMMAAGLCSAAWGESAWAMSGASASTVVERDVAAMLVAAGWAPEAGPRSSDDGRSTGVSAVLEHVDAARDALDWRLRGMARAAVGQVIWRADVMAGWMECGLYADAPAPRRDAAPLVGDASLCSELELLLLDAGTPVWPRMETVLSVASATPPRSAAWVYEPEIMPADVVQAPLAQAAPTMMAQDTASGATGPGEPLEAILPVMALAFGGFVLLVPLVTMWLMGHAARAPGAGEASTAGRVSPAGEETSRRAA